MTDVKIPRDCLQPRGNMAVVLLSPFVSGIVNLVKSTAAQKWLLLQFNVEGVRREI